MIATALQRLRVHPLRDLIASATLGPRMRRVLLALLAVTVLLAAGYLLWLRNSSLVRVENVTVTGVTGDDAKRVRSALGGAARQSTTLNVDEGAIESAAQSFSTIRAVEIEPDFPNGMQIHVLEHHPAALLVGRGKRIPVAGDGSLLSGLPVKGPLPEIELKGSLPVRQLARGSALDAARIAGAAPAALTPRLEAIERGGRRGIVVRVKGGPELVFGNASRLAAKWAAATRVLADRDATGADYIDVRIPERPVAGGLPVHTVAPLAPAGELGPAAPVPDTQTQEPQAPEAPQEPSAGTQDGAAGAAPPASPPAVANGGGAAVNPQP